MNAKLPLSVVILCHNEAHNLPRCLAALDGFSDVVVVDDGSTDGSVALAESLGARVVNHPFTSFADQRNWAMAKGNLRHDWVLHLDADEVMTAALQCELCRFLKSCRGPDHEAPEVDGVRRTRSAHGREAASGEAAPPGPVGFIARKVMLGESWLRFSAGYPVYVPRLVHRDGPRFYMRGHGEWMDAQADRQIRFQEPMLHYNFSRGWPDWWERHERYSSDEARRILAGLPPVSISSLFSSDPTARRAAIRGLSYRLPGRPLLRFAYSYLFKLGFLDGRAGWDFCRAMMEYERMIDRKVRKLRS